MRRTAALLFAAAVGSGTTTAAWWFGGPLGHPAVPVGLAVTCLFASFAVTAGLAAALARAWRAPADEPDGETW